MEDLPYGLLLEEIYEHHQRHTAPPRQFSQSLGYKETRQFAPKGSLVIAITHMPSSSGANYKSMSKPTIPLHCKSEQVYKLTEQQKDLLEGVKHLQDRIEVLHKLDWVENLKVGHLVNVVIPTIPYPVQSVIRYIGKLPEEEGIKFGVELKERNGEGKSDGKYRGVQLFHCDPYCAVFISMDQLTQRSYGNAAETTSVTRDRLPSVQEDLCTSGIFSSTRLNSYVIISDTDTVQTKVYQDLSLPVGTSEYLRKDEKSSTNTDTEAFGITDKKTIVKQQTALQKFERRQNITMRQTGQHQRIQQSKEELQLVDSGSFDSFMLDSEKQKKIYEDAVTENRKQGPPLGSSPPNENPDNLVVGSMVQFCNPPFYGIIKWIGQFPPASCMMAGVELEKPEEDFAGKYTDGWLGGIELFQSKPNRGVFLALSGLHPDKRQCSLLSPDYGNMATSNSTESTNASKIILQAADAEMQASTLDTSMQTDQFQVYDAVGAGVQTNQYTTVDSSAQINRYSTVDTTDQLQTDSSMVEKLRFDLENMKAQFEEQLKNVKTSLQEQILLTQQQLVGLQSMITLSKLWVVPRNEVKINEKIDQGAWAAVNKAMFRGTDIAVKRLHRSIISSKTKALFQREMEMALSCQHQHIVTFIGATLDDKPPMILMELMHLNLKSAYEQGGVTSTKMLKVAHEIAMALHFLHTRPDPVIHRDVSSANVLLKVLYNGDWLAKLGDLGTVNIQHQTNTPGPGALAYGAPEVSNPEEHSPKMDVYSFGVVVIETLTKTHPFQMVDTLRDQVKKQYPKYYHLVTSCTQQQPSGRPTMHDVLLQLDGIGT